MSFFRRKTWWEKLHVSDTIRAQTKARFDRLMGQGLNEQDARARVTAWALSEQRKLDTATRNDPWATSGAK